MQPLRSHSNALKEAIEIYKQTLPFQDHAAAVRETRIKEELLKQMRDERTGREYVDNNEKHEEMKTKLQAIETDVMAMTKKIRDLLPPDMPTDRDAAVDYVKSKKGDVKDLAVDRLEVMGASISEFMGGYRQGKQEGVDHIYSKEGEKYFASFEIMDEIDQVTKKEKKEIELGKESNQSTADMNILNTQKDTILENKGIQSESALKDDRNGSGVLV